VSLLKRYEQAQTAPPQPEDLAPSRLQAIRASDRLKPGGGQGESGLLDLKTRVQNKLLTELDPSMDVNRTAEVRQTIEELFEGILAEENIVLSRAEKRRLFEAIVAEILGFGPLETLLADDGVTEIMVNGHKDVYVERKGKIERVNVVFESDEHVLRIMDRIVSPLGRRIDESSPYVDARLPDGSRVNAVIPPISLVGPVLTIRKFARIPITVEDMVRFGSITSEAMEFLKACVISRMNMVISGGTGSGKTTLLNILSQFIPGDERILTIENAAELQLRQEHVVSLESRLEMPAHPDEIREAEEEGITLVPGLGPKAILGENGRVVGVETLDVASLFDSAGRFNPTFVPGSERRLEADTIIMAVGQQPDPTCLAADAEIEITPSGLVKVDPATLATTMAGVYCGGDLAFGPRIVISAEADGKRAALAIHESLGGGTVPRVRARFRPIELNRAGDHYDRIPRQAVPALPVARRTGFREVDEGYSEAQARLEASRCLWCNVETIFDSERCILCSGCVEICPEGCLTLVPASQLRPRPDLDAVREALGADDKMGAIVKDETRCIRCGLCAERCPTGAITMESLEIDESPQTALGLYHEAMNEVG